MSTPSKRPPKSRIEAFIPLIAGGVGGTTGAIVTCPLEVVKTRLQSSNSGFPDDYVSVKGKHSIVHLKRKGKGKGGGPGGTAGGGAGGADQNGDIHKTAKQEAIADSKHANHKVVAVEQIAAEKRVGPLQTTIPVASKSAANASITSNIAASSSTSGSIYSRYSNSKVSFFSSTTSRLPAKQQILHTYNLQHPTVNASYRHRYFKPWDVALRCCSSTISSAPTKAPKTMNVFQCLKFIYVTEGIFGLWKGIGPNLMGVAPSRAIYFWAYSTAKKNINSALPRKNRDTPFVHVVSAMSAGFSASTTTNPVWLIKTRLQLDRDSGKHRLTIRNSIRNIYIEGGILGFWKGVTASYWGISETVIHFVIYEALKKQLAQYQDKRKGQEKTFIDFAGFMLCGACSKTCATCIAYPHEVARTRLREEGSRYKSFWQSLGLVYREEGRRGLYRGLATQLVRQIPNTAIMMSTYELTVYVLTKWLKQSQSTLAGQDPGHQLKSDLRDAASDCPASNPSSAYSESENAKQPTSAVRLKTPHSQ